MKYLRFISLNIEALLLMQRLSLQSTYWIGDQFLNMYIYICR